MTNIKIPYFIYTHGEGFYSSIPFYKVIRIILLQWFSGPGTCFRRIEWDRVPRRINFKSKPRKRVPRIKK